MKGKGYLLIIVLFLFTCVNINLHAGDWTNIVVGKNIKFDGFILNIKSVKTSTKTPQNKVKSPSDKHYIILETKVVKITPKTKIATNRFVLVTSKKEKYIKPGSWGKIKVMGSLSNFESSSGASTYIRKVNKKINLFFLVPNNMNQNKFRLKYEKSIK